MTRSEFKQGLPAVFADPAPSYPSVEPVRSVIVSEDLQDEKLYSSISERGSLLPVREYRADLV